MRIRKALGFVLKKYNSYYKNDPGEQSLESCLHAIKTDLANTEDCLRVNGCNDFTFKQVVRLGAKVLRFLVLHF